MALTLEQVAAQVRKLTSDEQRQLLGLLDDWLRDEAQAKQRLLAESLLEAGIITHLPKRDPDYERLRHPPIIVEGEPVSETIIRERR